MDAAIGSFECIAHNSIDDLLKAKDAITKALILPGSHVMSQIQSSLFASPERWLSLDNLALEALGTMVPGEIQKILLQYLVTLPRADKMAELTMRKMMNACKASSLEGAFLEYWLVAEPEIKMILLCNAPMILDMNGEKNRMDLFALMENSSNDICRDYCIFKMLNSLLTQGFSVPTVWFDRALQLLPRCINLPEALCIIRFLVDFAKDPGSATRLLDHLSIHVDLGLFSRSGQERSSKRLKLHNPASKTFSIYPDASFAQVIHGIVYNKHVYSTFEALVKQKWSPVASFLLLNIWKIYPLASKLCLLRYSQMSIADRDHTIVSISAFLSQSTENLSSLIKLGNFCAVNGALEEAGLIFTQAMKVYEVYEAREIVENISNLITCSESSSWALVLLKQFCEELSHILVRHVTLLKVVLDHLGNLDSNGLLTYYSCLLSLAEYSITQTGDTALWNESIMIFRKQLTSGSSVIKWYGMHGLLSLTELLWSEGDTRGLLDPMEASCSQVPQHHSTSDRFVGPCLELFRIALSKHILDFKGASLLCQVLSPSMIKMNTTTLKRLNALFSEVLENAFIYELGKPPVSRFEGSSSLQFDIDGDEALIGITLFDKAPLECSICAGSLLTLVASLEKARNGKGLENIDTILGCPLLLPPQDPSTAKLVDLETMQLVICNWLRALVIAFCDQEDKEVLRKCRLRLEQLVDISCSNLFFSGGKVVPTSGKSEDRVIDIAALEESSSLSQFLCQLELGHPSSLNNVAPTIETVEYGVLAFPPRVYLEYLLPSSPSPSSSDDQLSDFLMRDIINADLESWTVEEVETVAERIVASSAIRGRAIVALERLFKALQLEKSQKLASLEELLSAAVRPGDLDIEEMLQILTMISPSRLALWDALIEPAKNLCFSSEISSIQVGQLAEKLVLLYDCDPAIISSLLSRMEGATFTVERKRIEIHTSLLKTLARCALETFEKVQLVVPLFDKMVQMTRGNVEAGYVEATLRHGRLFIERFSREALPLMKNLFVSHRKPILDTFKTLQAATRSIQIICNHIKPLKQPKYKTLLPPMRRALESLLFTVKGILQANNCLSAFWIGNLKHRSIDGAEACSQITIEVSSSADELSETSECTMGIKSNLSRELVSDTDTQL